MTNQNNITQAAGQEIGFSDDQLLAIATAAWETNSKEAYSPDGLLMACAAVQAALLSKLRAPVADERAAFDPEVLAERLRDVAASHYETALGFGISRDNFERCATDAAKIAHDMASAPVAGEAQPVCWIEKDVLESVRDEGSDAWVYWRPAGHVAEHDEMPLFAAPQASEVKPVARIDGFGNLTWLTSDAPFNSYLYATPQTGKPKFADTYEGVANG